jgi:hypothetical protein
VDAVGVHDKNRLNHAVNHNKIEVGKDVSTSPKAVEGVPGIAAKPRALKA